MLRQTHQQHLTSCYVDVQQLEDVQPHRMIWQTKCRDLSSTNKDLHREERFQALLLGYHDNEQTSYNNRLNANFKKTKFERLFG